MLRYKSAGVYLKCRCSQDLACIFRYRLQDISFYLSNCTVYNNAANGLSLFFLLHTCTRIINENPFLGCSTNNCHYTTACYETISSPRSTCPVVYLFNWTLQLELEVFFILYQIPLACCQFTLNHQLLRSHGVAVNIQDGFYVGSQRKKCHLTAAEEWSMKRYNEEWLCKKVHDKVRVVLV